MIIFYVIKKLIVYSFINQNLFFYILEIIRKFV